MPPLKGTSSLLPPPPKQYRRRWYCDDTPDGKFRVIARGRHSTTEVMQLVHDLRSLLVEAGHPILAVENVESKSILIDKLEDGAQLYVHGTYSAMEVLLIIAKLK